MKKTRRFAAFVASVLAVAAMAAPMTAFAAETSVTLDQTDTSSSIVITNDVKGYDYAAYQVFKGKLVKTTDDSTTPATVTYGVLTEVAWGENIVTDTAKLTELYGKLADITDDAGKYPFRVGGVSTGAALTSPSDVATELAKYSAFDNSVAQDFAAVIKNYITGTAVDGEAAYADGKYTLDGLKPGYYFVENTEVPAYSEPTDTEEGVSTGAYTRYILGVAGKVEVNQKSSIPSVVKKVEENTDVSDYEYVTGKTHANYNDVADYSMTDDVSFKLYGTMPSTLNADYEHYRYVFHDTMMPQLTLKQATIVVEIIDKAGNVKAKTNPTAEETAAGVITLTAGTDYIVITDTDDDCTFEVEFEDIMAIDLDSTQNGTQSILSTDMVIVSYDATLNEDAVIGLDGQENEVYLEYTNTSYYDGQGEKIPSDTDTDGDGDVDEDDVKDNPTDETGRTPIDKVIVFTYELDVTKVDGASTTTKLPGAEFQLLNGEGADAKAASVVDGKFAGWVAATDATTKLTTDENGLIKVKGLDDGVYYLKETAPPTGYNPLTNLVKVVIDATTVNNQEWAGEPAEALTALEIDVTQDGKTTSGTGVLDSEDIANGIVNATVANNKGTTLPSTGGMGTTLFYVGGGALALGAGVLLVSKKRMANK